uniref:Small EDRK-rich factor-like N-terminal domain-containing protein n=1 Tax=Acrobeloides nanus TaxID=290746 RepID=A0A914EEH6_9BILA
MTRGNQRDLARAKNAKKQEQLKKTQAASNKSGNAGVSTEKRMDRDADIMRQKQEKAAALKAEQEAGDKQTAKVVKVDPLKGL